MLPGDPGRCDEIAKYLEDAHLVAYNREFKTYTGYLSGEKVSVCSTGIGGPSAAIAVQELYNCGADTFIRVGTCGGMQERVMSGDVVIGMSAVRAEGTSKEIAPIEYPACADFQVVSALVGAAEKEGVATHTGTIQCKDLFYGQHAPEAQASSPELLAKWDAWKKMGCLASEMESSTIYILSSLLGARAGGCYSVVANQEREKAGLHNPVNHDTDAAVRIAIGAIKSLIAQDKQAALEELLDKLDPQVLLFDFDGTVAFTEGLSYLAFADTLAKYGVKDFGDEQWSALIGNTDADNWETCRKWYPDCPIPDDTEALINESREIFLEYARERLQLNDWVARYASHRRDIPHIIVSNNKQEVLKETLDILGIADMFDDIVSCADMNISKEEGWRRALDGVLFDDAVVFEDNIGAINKALELGSAVVAVRHIYNQAELENASDISLIM